jgi:hypothetical protein
MATTIDAIVDRVRSVCVEVPFAFTEAVSTEDFVLQGAGSSDRVFRVKARGGLVRGLIGMQEERTDSVDVDIIRAVSADYDAARRSLLRDATSLTAAIVRDGHTASGGEYTVPPDGRSLAIVGERGAAFLTLRLTVPANYECLL